MNNNLIDPAPTDDGMPPEEQRRIEAMYEEMRLQTDSTRIAGRIARTYAESLLAVADERGEADDIAAQFDALFGDVFPANPDLETFLDSPVAGKVRKDAMIDTAFAGRASGLFLDFLKLLNHKGRLGVLRLVAIAFRALREDQADRARVLVETAVPLSDSQRADLERALTTAMKKTPVLVIREKPELIGGLVVHIGDRVVDTSVRSRLQALRTKLLARGSHAIQRG